MTQMAKAFHGILISTGVQVKKKNKTCLNKLEFCGSLRPPKSLHAFFKNHPTEKNLVHNTFQIIDSLEKQSDSGIKSQE